MDRKLLETSQSGGRSCWVVWNAVFMGELATFHMLAPQ